LESIEPNDFIIEYTGELIREYIADEREKQWSAASYFFRIDETWIIDATKKGNMARFMNHSCDPNCNAKIIPSGGKKKVVVYAQKEINIGDEITYDYKFPLEDDKIKCYCGSVKCRGTLN
jgi:SET domain-containing protein